MIKKKQHLHKSKIENVKQATKITENQIHIGILIT